MNTIKQQHTNLHVRVLWLAVVCALFAAVCYLLIGLRVLAVGDLQPAEQPTPIIVAAATCYIVGGLLILLHRRWLWMLGALMNALVMLMFFSAYIDRPAVLFSPGGLATKTAQLVLEVSLLVLIAIRAKRHAPQTSAV